MKFSRIIAFFFRWSVCNTDSAQDLTIAKMVKLKRKSNINSDYDSPSAVILPDHLIEENILTRLPVKSLISFKSVSKSWYLTISTPQFAKSHFSFSSSSSSQFILFTNDPYKLMLLRYDEFNNLKRPVKLDFNVDSRFQHILKSEQGRMVEFVGSCNGLVCLYIMTHWYYESRKSRCGFFFICNPATHHGHEISNPASVNLTDSQEFVMGKYWFGYIPSIDDYKIVALSSNSSYIYVFSLRTGKWNRICDTADKLFLYTVKSLLLWKHAVVYDDILYWSFRLSYNNDRKIECIVGFNLVNEQFKVFPRMDWLMEYTKAYFFVMNGCLSLFCVSSKPVSDVWTLKQGNDWRYWEKSFSLLFGDMKFLNITPSGIFLARGYNLQTRLTQFKIFDLSQDNVVQSSLDSNFDWNLMSAGDYVESLISPFGGV